MKMFRSIPTDDVPIRRCDRGQNPHGRLNGVLGFCPASGGFLVAVVFLLFFTLVGTARAQNTQWGVGLYDLSTGTAVNATLISGLDLNFISSCIALYDGNLLAQIVGEPVGSPSTVAVFNRSTGAAVASPFGSYLGSPHGMTVSGNTLFVVRYYGGANVISSYDIPSGTLLSPVLVSLGIDDIGSLTVDGGNLYVTNYRSGTIGVYNPTTGVAVNDALVSGLDHPRGIAVSGGTLFVVNDFTETIGAYNALTGATINATLVGGLHSPFQLAAAGENLFVSTNNGVGVYNLTTGATVNSSLIVLDHAGGIAISGNSLYVAYDLGSSAIPEPTTYAAFFGLTALGFAAFQRRRKMKSV